MPLMPTRLFRAAIVTVVTAACAPAGAAGQQIPASSVAVAVQSGPLERLVSRTQGSGQRLMVARELGALRIAWCAPPDQTGSQILSRCAELVGGSVVRVGERRDLEPQARVLGAEREWVPARLAAAMGNCEQAARWREEGDPRAVTLPRSLLNYMSGIGGG